MKRLAILQVLLILAMTWFAQVQGQVYLHGVEPARGRPGDSLELTLRGVGFLTARQVRVTKGWWCAVSDWPLEGSDVSD